MAAAPPLDGEGLLWFAGAILVTFAAVYISGRLFKPRGLTGAATFATFSRMYGLIAVAVLAVLLAYTSVPDEARAAAFALLGTIAGFLAGASGPSKTTTTTPGDGKGKGEGDVEGDVEGDDKQRGATTTTERSGI